MIVTAIRIPVPLPIAAERSAATERRPRIAQDIDRRLAESDDEGKNYEEDLSVKVE